MNQNDSTKPEMAMGHSGDSLDKCQKENKIIVGKETQQSVQPYDDLALRLKAVPAKAFLRLPTGTPLISAEIMIGELCQEAAERIKDYEDVLADKRRLTRELDVALNGNDAAKQASLCDIVAQVKAAKRESSSDIADRMAIRDKAIEEVAAHYHGAMADFYQEEAAQESLPGIAEDWHATATTHRTYAREIRAQVWLTDEFQPNKTEGEKL